MDTATEDNEVNSPTVPEGVRPRLYTKDDWLNSSISSAEAMEANGEAAQFWEGIAAHLDGVIAEKDAAIAAAEAKAAAVVPAGHAVIRVEALQQAIEYLGTCPYAAVQPIIQAIQQHTTIPERKG